MTFSFPDDLREAQRELHQVSAELSALGKTLPWSVEPHEGWARPEGHWYPSERPATSGWTEEQKNTVSALRARALELSIAVGTHAFWETVEPGKVVAARTALKHVHDQERGQEAADGASSDGYGAAA
ncbi:hypothetical protein J1792_24980 [Streptomyces triculaminicus]|uniref:Uncharacterized protein n=3 Tax=Streptomyces TaxID=1883 RepID=A0A939FS87_9ACTN|nr:hypothetical protein [Streptomyces griseocarneus]MBO0655909.1 hypothetical protein [Streptomyces triculaminicus]QSY52224.1 hypothetical protein J3S04_02125 [Streptomyces griseocarneus]